MLRTLASERCPASLSGVNDLDCLARAAQRGYRVAVAESLTSGLLCSVVGKGDCASEWFAGGIVAYFTETK